MFRIQQLMSGLLMHKDNPFAKMESRPPSTEFLKVAEEAILRDSSVLHEPQYFKIASFVGGRDDSDKHDCRNHFRRAPFSFGSLSFGRAKENEQPSLNTGAIRTIGRPSGTLREE